jgi:hypothetical protein
LWVRRNKFCKYAGIIVNYHRNIDYRKKDGYYSGGNNGNGYSLGSGTSGGYSTCGGGGSILSVVAPSNDDEDKNYSDYYERRDIFGQKGRIIDIQEHGLVIELEDNKYEDKRIYIGYESIISENKRCLLWIGSRSGEKVLLNGTYVKSKKLLIKKHFMPRIFRYAIYLGVVVLWWKLVNNAEGITAFFVSLLTN